MLIGREYECNILLDLLSIGWSKFIARYDGQCKGPRVHDAGIRTPMPSR